MKPNYPMELNIYTHAVTPLKRKLRHLQKQINPTEQMLIDLEKCKTELSYINYKLKEWRESQ